MKQNITKMIMLALAASKTVHAFAPATIHQRSLTMARSDVSGPLYVGATVDHDFPTTIEQESIEQQQQSEKPKSVKKSPPKPKHQEGILSPVVLLAKDVLGDEKLNKLRAKVISMHSDVIGGFVDTAETAVGQAVMKVLFGTADKNHNGKIEEEELADFLHTLGFEWLKEKQIHGILARADANEDGAIDFEEWVKEAPKTLRTNLIKLAKKNGGELGLLV